MSDFDYGDYLSPFEPGKEQFGNSKHDPELLVNSVTFRKNETTEKEIHQFDLALIGINDDRNSHQRGTGNGADEIRKEFYKFYAPGKLNLIDLGNIKNGKTVKDTYTAITEVIYNLLLNESAIILLGGSKDMIIPVCNAYKRGKKNFSICTAEPEFCLGNTVETPTPGTYLSYIIEHNKRLYNYSNIGYQSYYNSLENIAYINKHFEAVRLGIARTFIFQNEPYIRDADFFAVDIRSIKHSDAPGTENASVNGFYGEEICQLSRYAGLSDKTSVFGIFEFNPKFDKHQKTAELSAQMMWYFIQSFYNRKREFSETIIKKFKKYIVNIDGISDNVIFYKSPKSGRWWVEVNYNVGNDERSKLIACSYEDYLKATRNEIPERWWKYFNKLN